MKKILITGHQGFVGENLTEKLEEDSRYSIIKFGRQQNAKELENALKEADFIFHLAGVNRPIEEKEFFEGNSGLTKKIADMLIANEKKTGIVLSSSIQAALDNPYGRSKALAENEMIRYSEATGAPVYIYRLPNLFGKGVKPNYNSVVATFLYSIKYDKDITINDPEKMLTLVYIDDLLEEFHEVLEGHRKPATEFYSVAKTYQITLGELARCIYDIKSDKLLNVDIYKPLWETYQTY